VSNRINKQEKKANGLKFQSAKNGCMKTAQFAISTNAAMVSDVKNFSKKKKNFENNEGKLGRRPTLSER
jgi:hypothetical protein